MKGCPVPGAPPATDLSRHDLQVLRPPRPEATAGQFPVPRRATSEASRASSCVWQPERVLCWQPLGQCCAAARQPTAGSPRPQGPLTCACPTWGTKGPMRELFDKSSPSRSRVLS